jgi:hypothetical protein
VVPLPVEQPAWLLLFSERAGQQIFEKQGAQVLDRGLIKRGEKTAERRTGRQAVASEQGHERACPGLETLVKGFQGPLGAYGIAEKDGKKSDHRVRAQSGDGQSAPALKFPQARPDGVSGKQSQSLPRTTMASRGQTLERSGCL